MGGLRPAQRIHTLARNLDASRATTSPEEGGSNSNINGVDDGGSDSSADEDY